MLFSTVFASAVLPILALAGPLKRAGGPAFVPIPANCTLVNPLPHASHHCGNGTVSGWMPSNKTLHNEIYSWYLSEPDFETVNNRWSGCIEQCNGLSGCKSAFMAYNNPTPKGYFGTAGGVLDVGCQFFNVSLTPNDFVAAPAGQYVNATAGNIYCPLSAAVSLSTATSASSHSKSTTSSHSKSTTSSHSKLTTSSHSKLTTSSHSKSATTSHAKSSASA